MTSPDSSTAESIPTRAGVVGAGAMGTNHARVYSELPTVDLVGVADLDDDRARQVADRHGGTAHAVDDLVDACDVVTVAVPTAAHYDVARACLDAGVDVLIEKPITADPERGRELMALAAERDLTLQVGHVERFNPAVDTLRSVIDDVEVLAIEAERLGPPVDRTESDGVALDLMIHDVDVVQSLLGATPTAVGATGTADGQYATATVEYGDVVGRFTASRVTQRKIRRLTVTARECLIEVDYLGRSVLIYRESFPEYVTDDGAARYRHENVIERPRVGDAEPLRAELEAFVEAARTGSEPPVTAEDGLRALETVRTIDRLVSERPEGTSEPARDASDVDDGVEVQSR